MTIPKAAITINCNTSLHQIEDTNMLARLLEDEKIDATWFFEISNTEQDQIIIQNIRKCISLMPLTHEIAVKVSFEKDGKYLDNENKRKAVLERALNIFQILKINVNAIQTDSFALTQYDVHCIKNYGIHIDSSFIPDEQFNTFFYPIQQKNKTRITHSFKDNSYPKKNKIYRIPVSSYQGRYCTLDKGVQLLLSIIDHILLQDDMICISVQNQAEQINTLNKILHYLKNTGAQFETLSEMVGLRFENSDIGRLSA